MAREYVAVPFDFKDEMETLSDAEFGRLIRAMLDYAMTGESTALRGNERFFANRIKATEDRHRKSYDTLCATRSLAGKAGAQAKKQAAANGSNAQQTAQIENEIKNENETKSLFSYEKKAPRGRAAPQKRDNSWMKQYD